MVYVIRIELILRRMRYFLLGTNTYIFGSFLRRHDERFTNPDAS